MSGAFGGLRSDGGSRRPSRERSSISDARWEAEEGRRVRVRIGGVCERALGSSEVAATVVDVYGPRGTRTMRYCYAHLRSRCCLQSYKGPLVSYRDSSVSVIVILETSYNYSRNSLELARLPSTSCVSPSAELEHQSVKHCGNHCQPKPCYPPWNPSFGNSGRTLNFDRSIPPSRSQSVRPQKSPAHASRAGSPARGFCTCSSPGRWGARRIFERAVPQFCARRCLDDPPAVISMGNERR
ncbi:hypothetical protein K466DRAFT_342011 [Polyporus arcularius HHB13444]|uniref:Uncharacterized protein n=1 Tax=Polyporus arcularius HHB13444 TaxID=1314778 RepID=A0A5C3NV59_9APHY|nr:hypothetical protein K466DRAFT_342011 [Polyporus arcularius HHB13444]